MGNAPLGHLVTVHPERFVMRCEGALFNTGGGWLLCVCVGGSLMGLLADGSSCLGRIPESCFFMSPPVSAPLLLLSPHSPGPRPSLLYCEIQLGPSC